MRSPIKKILIMTSLWLLLFSGVGICGTNSIFLDTFDSNANNWLTQNRLDYVLKIEAGFYNFGRYGSSAPTATLQEIVVNQETDFSVETSVKKISGTNTNAYFGLRWEDGSGNNYFDFGINGFGKVMISRVSAEIETLILNVTNSPAVIQGNGAVNKLEIRKTNTSLEFYINDSQVHSMVFDAFIGNKIGFFLYGIHSIAFDYLDVSQDSNCGETAPDIITHTSPTGAITDGTPTYTWNKNACATWYKLWVGDAGENRLYAKWYDADDICSGSTCSVTLGSAGSADLASLRSGSYTWYVKSWNDSGSIWSNGAAFSVQVDDDPALPVVLTSPSGQTDDTTPTFRWQQDEASTWYKLWVGDTADNMKFKNWYDASQICSDGVCSVTLASPLTDDDCEWYVKSFNDYGSVWSGGKSFRLGLGADGAEIAQTVQKTLALLSIQEELAPMTDEVSAVLADVLSGDPNVPVTFSPPIATLQTLLETVVSTGDFSSLPSTIRMVLNYGNGYTAVDGSRMTGNMTVLISGLSVSLTSGVTATLNIDANNIKKDGVLVLNGDINVAAVVGISNDTFSADVDITVSNLTTNMGKTSGAINISMPYLSMDTATLDTSSLAFEPITITFTNFVAADYTINSGDVKISSGASADTILVEPDLKTSEGNVKGKVSIDASNSDQTTLSSIGTVQMGDYVLDLNGVVFDPEACDYPTDGNIGLTHDGENYTVTFTEECKAYTLE